MKKSLIALAIPALLLLILSSVPACKKSVKADFSYSFSADHPYMVKFVNHSENYTRSQWDFGDGSTSESQDVDHQFDYPGTYVVTLKVYGESQNDMATKEINVY